MPHGLEPARQTILTYRAVCPGEPEHHAGFAGMARTLTQVRQLAIRGLRPVEEPHGVVTLWVIEHVGDSCRLLRFKLLDSCEPKLAVTEKFTPLPFPFLVRRREWEAFQLCIYGMRRSEGRIQAAPLVQFCRGSIYLSGNCWPERQVRCLLVVQRDRTFDVVADVVCGSISRWIVTDDPRYCSEEQKQKTNENPTASSPIVKVEHFFTSEFWPCCRRAI